jgi:hypothetical protein
MRNLLNAFFAAIAMFVVVVAEHRGFVYSFVIAFACAVATIIPAERYPQRTHLLRKRSIVAVLWLALLISFGWEANEWARAGKPANRLFSVHQIARTG